MKNTVHNIQQRARIHRVPVPERALGVRLPRGNPVLVINTPRKDIPNWYGERLIHIFNRIQKTGQTGIHLNAVSHNGKNRYEKWLVKILLKGKLIKTVDRKLQMRTAA